MVRKIYYKKTEFKVQKKAISYESPEVVELDGYFHRWVDKFFSDEGGVQSVTYAIVEESDGKIIEVKPADIQFKHPPKEVE